MLWTRWLVLLLCWGATSGEQQAAYERAATPAEVRTDSRRQRSPPPVEPLDFGFVPAAVYDTHAYYEPGAIGILFHVVHAFLYVVQPHSFPQGENVVNPHPVSKAAEASLVLSGNHLLYVSHLLGISSIK